MPHLVKHALRPSATTLSSAYRPHTWHPLLEATLVGPASAGHVTVHWTKPDGTPWFRADAPTPELDIAEVHTVRLDGADDLDLDTAGTVPFRVSFTPHREDAGELLHDGQLGVDSVADSGVFRVDETWRRTLVVLSFDIVEEIDAPMLRVTTYVEGEPEPWAIEATLWRDGQTVATGSAESGRSTRASDGSISSGELVTLFPSVRAWNNLRAEGWGDDNWLLLDESSGSYELRIGDCVASFDIVGGRLQVDGVIEPDEAGRPSAWLRPVDNADAYGDPHTGRVEWDSTMLYACCSAPTGDDAADVSSCSPALQQWVDSAGTLLDLWEDDLRAGIEAANSRTDFLAQCECVVIPDAIKWLSRRGEFSEFGDDDTVSLAGTSTSLGSVIARVDRMHTLAQAHLDDAARQRDMTLDPYRAVLKHDKLQIFEDHPASEYRYYTTDKRVIETPADLADASFWYFEGSRHSAATVTADTVRADVLVDGWRVLGWRFDAEGRIVERYEEQGNGRSAPLTAFRHE